MPFDELSESIVAVSVREAIVLIFLFQESCNVAEEVFLVEAVHYREVIGIVKYCYVILLASDYFAIFSALLVDSHQLLELKRSLRRL